MKSNHRTQFLFIHPEIPPTELPIEDGITAKVDYIFSQLQPSGDGGYRGTHVTPFGVDSDSSDYVHKTFSIVSNSLAPYYARFHRADVSEKELNWINDLYLILQNPNYYTLKSKPVYYFKAYEKQGKGYGNAKTFAVKAIGNQAGITTLLAGTFYKELTKSEFNELTKGVNLAFNPKVEGCELIDIYDVLKVGSFIPY
jgi:hypothetical protein